MLAQILSSASDRSWWLPSRIVCQGGRSSFCVHLCRTRKVGAKRARVCKCKPAHVTPTVSHRLFLLAISFCSEKPLRENFAGSSLDVCLRSIFNAVFGWGMLSRNYMPSSFVRENLFFFANSNRNATQCLPCKLRRGSTVLSLNFFTRITRNSRLFFLSDTSLYQVYLSTMV